MDKQLSSVSGRRWKGLTNKDYKEKKQKIAGNKDADLFLEGKMQASLKAKQVGQNIEVGIFDEKQAKKADGHCHTGVFGDSSLPKRQFIPKEDEDFRAGIKKGIKKILKDLNS